MYINSGLDGVYMDMHNNIVLLLGDVDRNLLYPSEEASQDMAFSYS
jgi:hypothetical protein